MTIMRELTHSRWFLLGLLPLAALAHAQATDPNPAPLPETKAGGSPRYAL